VTKEKKLVTIEDIIDRRIHEVEVPGYGVVKYRDPTMGERLDAVKEAKEDPRWEYLDEAQRLSLISDFVVLKMLVEPKITKEQYYNASVIALGNIMDAVWTDYNIRYMKIREKRLKQIKDFLKLTKESLALNSTIS